MTPVRIVSYITSVSGAVLVRVVGVGPFPVGAAATEVHIVGTGAQPATATAVTIASTGAPIWISGGGRA